jgi:hypothetical protein
MVIRIKQSPNQPVVRVQTEKAFLRVKFILVPLLEHHALALVIDRIILDDGLGFNNTKAEV